MVSFEHSLTRVTGRERPGGSPRDPIGIAGVTPSPGGASRRRLTLRRYPILGLTVLLLLTLSGGRGDGPSPGHAEELPLDRDRFIGIDEIKPGMRGTGLTTFSNRGVEEFEVEVIGVMRRWIPGGDLILVEATGGPLAETGIYRGMSGSPIYLDGRLAGAISYNMGGFAERPIAGVTPIGEMLSLFTSASAEAPPARGLEGDETEEQSAGHGDDAGDEASRPASRRGPSAMVRGRLVAPNDVEPIRTPIVLAGFAPATRAAMGGFLKQYGVEAVSGGASGATSGAAKAASDEARGDAPLVPGAPVGVQIVRGDVEATALGTITLVDGERVLGFGHPMFQAGEVDLPMTTAEVFTVYPSQQVSFVLGAAADPVGRVVNDQQTGIAGRLGETSPMVPVSITIQRGRRGERSFAFEVVRDKFFLAQFVGFLAFNSFVADQKVFGDATLTLELEIELADGTTLDFDDVLASNVPPRTLAEAVSAPVTRLLFSGLEPVEIRRVRLQLGVSPEIRTAVIEELIVDRSEVEAGEAISATVFLRPHEAARRPIELTVPVPADARPGPILLRTCAAAEAAAWEAERAPRRFVPSTVGQLVDLYEESGAHHVMRVTLHGDARGVVVEGREMQGLPGSVFEIMDSNRRKGGRSGSWGRLLHEERVKTDHQLNGCQELRLDVTAPLVPANGGER
jgi:hypothetical protein